MRWGLALVVLFAGCTCRAKDKARVDGPITAAIVEQSGPLGVMIPTNRLENPTHVTDSPTSLGDTSSNRCDLVVTKPKALALDLGDCVEAGYELVAEPNGARLAYRPKKPGAPYRIIYFGGGGRSFETSSKAAPPLAWSAVTELDDAVLERIFRVDPSKLVLDEVRARGGDEALATFLEKTVGAGYSSSSTTEGGCGHAQSTWIGAACSLASGPRARLTEALTKTLHDPTTSGLALVRAMLLADLDREELRDDIEAIATRGAHDQMLTEPFALALLALARWKSIDASNLACWRLSGHFLGLYDSRPPADLRAAMVAIANAGRRCENVDNARTPDGSEPCVGPTAKEIVARSSEGRLAWLSEPDKELGRIHYGALTAGRDAGAGCDDARDGSTDAGVSRIQR